MTLTATRAVALPPRRSSAGVVLTAIAVLFVTTALILLSVDDPALGEWTAFTLVATAAMATLLGIRGRGLTGPLVVVLVVNITMIAGALMWRELVESGKASTTLAGDSPTLITALQISLQFTAALTAGALLALRKPKDASARTTPRLRMGALIMFGFAVLAASVYGRGVGILINGGEYLQFTGPNALHVLGDSLSPLSQLAFALVLSRGRGALRWWAAGGLALWVLALFAVATRQLAMVPMLMLLASFLGTTRPRFVLIKTAVALGVTAFLLNLATVMRGNPDGIGLRPLLTFLMSDGRPPIFDFYGGLSNVLFAAPLAGVVSERDLTPHAFWTSVNPLPGRYTDWGAVFPTLRINEFVPFNGLGELSAAGTTYLLGFATVVGFFLGLATNMARQFPAFIRTLGLTAVVGISGLYSLLLLQYNLRSSTRLLYYLAAVLVLLWILVTLRGRRDEDDSPSDGVGGKHAVVQLGVHEHARR